MLLFIDVLQDGQTFEYFEYFESEEM